MLVQCTCRTCGRLFETNPYRVAHGRGHFCSRACKSEGGPWPTRFWDRVDYGGPGCWPWLGVLNAYGYGRVRVDGRLEMAPRVVLKMIHGVWPTLACHHCDNPACCRPSHVYDGTPKSNTQDMMQRGRAKAPWALPGEQHPLAKLSAADIPLIRARRAAGESCKAISVDYGVTDGAIRHIVSGRRWR